MIGTLEQCIRRIKTQKRTHVLLRHGDLYKVLTATTPEGENALAMATEDTLIGVFRKGVPVHVIYESAGELYPEAVA